jgi:hypothetical protein
MNFGHCVNFGSEFEFWDFYNFGSSEMSTTRLTNNVSARGSSAKPMDRAGMACNNYGSGRPKIQSGGAFLGFRV